MFAAMAGFFPDESTAGGRDRADRATYFSPQAGKAVTAPAVAEARFAIGDVVRHRTHDFRGVIFDIDPVFANSDEWYESIPAAMRPPREQPFYHLFAENDESSYVAYVSQQNLICDGEAGPVDHPSIEMVFGDFDFLGGRYSLHHSLKH